LRLLASRDFRLLFVGQSLSQLGDTAATIAVAFAVLGITGSATALGIVLAARYVPLAGFLLVGGVAGDRANRRRLMLASDVARALTQALLAALLLSGHAAVWQIAVLQAVYGTAEAFFSPSLSGLVPELVARDQLQEANALLRSTASVSLIAGPVLGGLLVAAMGAEGAIVADAASFAVSAILLAQLVSWQTVERAAPRAGKFSADLRAGWHEVRARRWLTCSMGNAALFNAISIPAVVVLGPALARSELGGASAWSVLVAAFGAGSLAGSVASLRVKIVRPAAAAALLLALAATQPAALASGLGVLLIALLSFAGGAAAAMAAVAWASMVQQHVPGSALSRVNSIDDFATFLLMPVGYVIAGPLANALGLHMAMALLTAVPVLASLLTLSAPSVRGLTAVAQPATA
jgi:MFS family permease